MVKLKRVIESLNHIENLKRLLKFYSSNPDNWNKEWSVNPYYMVDLKRYGDGSCVCGHAIRYQFQFLNTVTGKKFPVGSVCVHLLDLAPFNDTVDHLERINQMAVQELNTDLEPEGFVKKYRKFYNLDNIEALLSYGPLNIPSFDLSIYKNNFKKRNLDSYTAKKMKGVIESLYTQSKEFIDKIESQSRPVTQAQVQSLVNDSAEEMLRFAKAKQKSLPFV